MTLFPFRLRIFPAICLIIAIYFMYHSVNGARGYRRMYQIKAEIVSARQYADEMHAKRQFLETKVKSLSPDSLDMDQLEDSASRILNMGHPEDIIVLSAGNT